MRILTSLPAWNPSRPRSWSACSPSSCSCSHRLPSARAAPVRYRSGASSSAATSTGHLRLRGLRPDGHRDHRPSHPEILRVFLDCPDGDCDFDYLRQAITFVNIVRDRKDSDVHVLVTSQRTGGGGWDCTINMLGQGPFAKMDRVIHYVTKSTDTSDETRKGIAQRLKLGLVQYVAEHPVAAELDVSHRRPAQAGTQGASRGSRDPWNAWVFSTSASLSASGASQQSSSSFSGSFSANRITEAWKFTSSASAYYSRSQYDFDDGTTFTAVTREFGANGMLVKSLGAHWAAGGRISASSSTYTNQRVALRAAPAIEYDLFPYAQSTRRQLTINYSVGLNRNEYHEVTVFDKLAETLVDHKALVSLDLKQPWGSNSTSFEFSQYLNDPEKHHVLLYNGTSVRLFKGFSLNVNGSVSRVRDQIYLPKGEASAEEVLASLRQLATSYRYSLRIGLSYRFGSIYNNVVNPRFSGSSGSYYFYN